jgi:hypothetical protein
LDGLTLPAGLQTLTIGKSNPSLEGLIMSAGLQDFAGIF